MKVKSWLLFTLKIAISAICLYYVFTKINFHQFYSVLKTINFYWFGIAILFFILSKTISAFRLNVYLKNINITITDIENLKLYWLGMFYNIFLPGGIGGDAYKVIILKKKFNKSYKSISAAVLLDRISGLVALIGLTVLFACFLYLPKWMLFSAVFTFIAGYLLYRFLLARYFSTHQNSITKTDLIGLAVQFLQGISIIAIAYSLSSGQNNFALLVIFYISSLSTLLPLSIGGLGARELIFLFGAKYLGFPQELSISLSLLFYMISLLVSSFGVYYVFGRTFNTKSV
jgi:uncharacterized membrane protein YbhN (UPF0104 family)